MRYSLRVSIGLLIVCALLVLFTACHGRAEMRCHWRWDNVYIMGTFTDSLLMVPESTILRFSGDSVQTYTLHCTR